jgi:hypothetical protein
MKSPHVTGVINARFQQNTCSIPDGIYHLPNLSLLHRAFHPHVEAGLWDKKGDTYRDTPDVLKPCIGCS